MRVLTVCVLILSLLTRADTATTILRIAYFQDGANIPSAFVQRAKKAGYSFVAAEFWPGCDTSVYRRAFATVRDGGLTLIPKIQLANCHSGGWLSAFPELANFNQVTSFYQGNPKYWMGCPSFADETTLGANGIDSCFRTVLQRIRDGVRSAGVSSLPYFHIGHDEPLFALSPDGVRWEGALCAGYGADVNGNGALESVEASATDRAFIAEYGRKHPGHRPELAFRTLLIRELAARIRQVRSVFGGETRILMYCDAWDPEQNGGRLRLTTYSGISLYLASDKNDGRDLADLPGLNAVEAADLRKALVVMPWQYLPKYGEQDYNTFKAFDYLKRKKYRFVFVSAMDDPRMNADYRRQIAEYLRTSRLFAGSALGYMAATWYTDSLHGWNPAKGPYEQHPAYDVLETVREIEGMQ